MDTMRVPGPDHPITITASPHRMQARYQGHVIADSADVLVLKEASYHPVCYFPRADVDMAYMGRTGRDTYCPYKGHASYFTLTMDGVIAEDAVWSYEAPYPAMSAIADRLAFFSHHVEVQEVSGNGSGLTVAEVIRHTDEGDGKSQADHWPANLTAPPQ